MIDRNRLLVGVILKTLLSTEDEIGIIFPFICPLGHYCPEGTSNYGEFPCQPGFYGSIVGLTDESECTPCWGGYYCDEPGAISGTGQTVTRSDEKLCEAGFYCPEGSDNSRAEDCRPGFYCEEGSSGPRPCPRGTSGNMPSQAQDRSECIPCPSGYYCTFEDLGDDSQIRELPCSDGYVCVQGRVVKIKLRFCKIVIFFNFLSHLKTPVKGAYSPTPAHYKLSPFARPGAVDDRDDEWVCTNVDSCFEEALSTWEDWEGKNPEELITGYPCQLGWECSKTWPTQEKKCDQAGFKTSRFMCYFSQCHLGNMSFKILPRDTINRLVLKIIVCSVQEGGFVTSKELLFQKYVRLVPIVLLEQAVNTQRFHVHQAHILIKRVSGRRVNAVHVLLENFVMLVQLLHKRVKQVITVRTMRPMINSMMNSAMVPVHLDFIANQEQLIRNHVHLEHTVLKLGSPIEVRRDVQIARKGTFAPSGVWDRRYK